MGIIDSESKIFISVSAKPGNLGATVYRGLFSRYSINAVYIPRFAPKTAAELSSAIRALNISGCSVSMPLKNKMIHELDESDEIVKKTQSVNTVVNCSGKLSGFNTDYEGVYDLISRYELSSAFVYGSGGVVGSVVEAVKAHGIEEINLSARSKEKGMISSDIHKVKYLPIDGFQKSNGKSMIFINATPVGWTDPDISQIESIIKESDVVFDLAPSRDETEVIRFAKQHNKVTISGVDLFKSQVRFQFAHYTGIMPDLNDVNSAFDS